MTNDYRILSRLCTNPVMVGFEVKFGPKKKAGTVFIATVWEHKYYLRAHAYPSEWVSIVTSEEEAIFEECARLEEEYNKEVEEEKLKKLKGSKK
jgi:hypothetical protein